jgi:hypothetical protein
VELLRQRRDSYHDARQVVEYLRAVASSAIQPPTLTTQTATAAMQHIVAVSDGIVQISGDKESAARLLFDDTPPATHAETEAGRPLESGASLLVIHSSFGAVASLGDHHSSFSFVRRRTCPNVRHLR